MTVLKSILVAAALFAASNAAVAMSVTGEGLHSACKAGALTPSGIWDCR